MTEKICIVGAESTGTTTMAKALAQHYETVWVPEYGRIYSESKLYSKNADQWTTKEFIHIARKQSEMEDDLGQLANRMIICDTNAFATAIWHERYMGRESQEVKKIAAKRKYAFYFLTDVNIPFVQDGTRDGEHLREWMHHRFEEELQKQKVTYAVLSGTHEERLKKAITLIDNLKK